MTQTVTLGIIDDDLFETNETFMAELELVDDTRVILQPSATDVSIILDNDSKHRNSYCIPLALWPF